MSTTADVAVLGSGVIGASVALELARVGRHVVVLDRFGGPAHGSTSASSAIVRFNYSTLDAVATSWESAHCWSTWADHLGERDPAGLASLRECGLVMLDAPAVPRERTISLFKAVGVPFEEWDGHRLRTAMGLDPGRFGPPKRVDDEEFFADPQGELGAIYTEDAGYVDDPGLATHNLVHAAQARGATFLFRRTVVAVEPRRGGTFRLGLADGSQVSAPVVVNAAGPWSSAVNHLAGVGGDFSVGVRALRQEVHQVSAPPNAPQAIVADLDLGVYLRPAPGGVLHIGGTEPECDPLEWVDDPDTFDPRPTAASFRAQVTRAARRVPGLRVPNAPTGIAHLYDVTDDWAPIYDRTDLDGFYVAIGTSGNQFKNAPLAGRFLARLVEAVEAGHDHDASPVTYPCEHIDRTIDLGVYSRRRVPNAASSGTVMG